MDQSKDNLEGDISRVAGKVNAINVFVVNMEAVDLLFFLSLALAPVIFGQTGLGFRDAGFVQQQLPDGAHHLASSLRHLRDSFPLYAAIAAWLSAVTYACWCVFAGIKRYWPYTAWNPRRIPYLSFTEDEFLIRGNIALPWTAFSDVGYSTIYVRTPYVTYLILTLKDAATLSAMPRVQQRLLTKYNFSALSRKMLTKASLSIKGFVTVKIDERCGLTIPTQLLLKLAQYCRGGGPIDSDLEAKIVAGKPIYKHGLIYFNIVYLAMAGFIITACAMHIWPTLKYEIDALQWPKADATILQARLGGGCRDADKIDPIVQYSFNYSGKSYVGHKQSLADLELLTTIASGKGLIELPESGNRCQSREKVIAMLGRLPAGTHTAAYFDPNDPDNSVLEKPSFTRATLAQVGLVSSLAGLLLALLAINLKIFLAEEDNIF